MSKLADDKTQEVRTLLTLFVKSSELIPGIPTVTSEVLDVTVA